MDKKKRRIVIIGLDGVPYRAIRKLSEKGVMKNTALLTEQGTLTKMESSIPEVSSVAWSSIITGKNPGEHGIFGFMEFYPQSYDLRFPNFNDLKSPPFWKKEEDVKSVIINVPSTFPVRELNGVHISGFVSPDLKRSVFPQVLIPKLQELGYRIDVDASLAHKSLDLFLHDLDRTLEARIGLYRYLWQEADWRIFMLCFTATDRLSHFLWDAYEDENHKYHGRFVSQFEKIDKVIGEISSRINSNDVLIMLSDHGFELLEDNVNVNFLLKEKGFLKLKKGSALNFSSIDYGTRAFALDPARIYINVKGKYPCGSIVAEDRNKVIGELEELFGSLEKNGRKVIRRICRKEEIFKGPFVEAAPDLTLVPEGGFNLKANIEAGQIYERNIFTGKHTQNDAFFFVNRKDDFLMSKGLSVFDVLEKIDVLRHG